MKNVIEEEYNHLSGNLGFLLTKLPLEIYSEVGNVVNNIQSDFKKAIPANTFLAGQIDREYNTQLTSKTIQYIKSTTEKYNRANPQYLLQQTNTNPPILKYNGHCWINFQEKYEYNPLHAHTGALSFVIWYQIPYYRENEIEHGPGIMKQKNSTNGDFEFYYFDGEKMVAMTMGIDKAKEGYMAIFPSSLHHEVHPFYTSDDYRITISGNIFLK